MQYLTTTKTKEREDDDKQEATSLARTIQWSPLSHPTPPETARKKKRTVAYCPSS